MKLVIPFVFFLLGLFLCPPRGISQSSRAYGMVMATVLKRKPQGVHPDYKCIGSVVRKNVSGMVLLYLYGNIYPGAGLLLSPVVPEAFASFYVARGSGDSVTRVNINSSVDIEGTGLMKVINDWLNLADEGEFVDPDYYKTYIVGETMKLAGKKEKPSEASASFDITINYN
jgi:hypothetical protein